MPAEAQQSPGDAARLTAGWIALASVFVAARFWVLHLAQRALNDGTWLTPWLPLAIYQDIALVVALAWLFEAALRRTSRIGFRRLFRLVAWGACLSAACYAVINTEIFRFLGTPLTYRLIAMSDNLRGIRSSIEAALTPDRLLAVISAPVILLVSAILLVRYGSRPLQRVRELASRRATRTALAAYLAVSLVVLRVSGIDASALANPHTAFLLSLGDRDDPFVSGSVSETDLLDFRPLSNRPGAPASEWLGRARNCNVLMIVMESVGRQALGHYGAPHDNTPELSRLAERGLTFERIYASQPYTSNAMAGIFCSLYPWHGWRSLPRRAPTLEVVGLGNVLQANGYRTALLHTGDMQFDNEKRFLEVHGFTHVHDVWSLKTLLSDYGEAANTPAETPGMHLHLPDALLLPAAMRWIDADSEATEPFFLALWTIQTHHPYFAQPSQRSFAPDDPELNRYLNAIRVSDQLLGDVVRGLEERGLADSTLVVVLGDHGEAFGEHAHRGHSKTVFEEELRVPLVMIAPRLTDTPRRLDVLGQQIDIAPTVLELLGLNAPPEWQGRSLFSNDRTNRVYCFTAFHHYLFGTIDGTHKYIFNATTNESRLYDLSRDPGERRNLIHAPPAGVSLDALHRRLAAWVHFQNQYLSTFLPRQ